MSKPMVLEVDVQTQEEIVREMTDSEHENYQKNLVQVIEPQHPNSASSFQFVIRSGDQ